MANPVGLDSNALDAQKVASLLGVNKALVYRLAKEGTLRSYTVGRKLRFTTDDVSRYVETAHGTASHGIGKTAVERDKSGMTDREPDSTDDGPDDVADSGIGTVGAASPRTSFTLSGSDLILDTLSSYLTGMGINVIRSYAGSYSSLVDLYAGRTQAAAIHLWDSRTGTCNVPYVRHLLPGTPCVVFSLAQIREGFLVAHGNPKHLREWGDLLASDIRIVNRKRGSGTRVLLDEHLTLLEADPLSIAGYDRELASELSLASFIARGGADVGIGSEKAFHRVEGIDFLPLQSEELSLVVCKDHATEGIIRLLRSLLPSRGFREEFAGEPGYDTSRMGRMTYEV